MKASSPPREAQEENDPGVKSAVPAGAGKSAIDRLRLTEPPPLNPAWRAYERAANLPTPPRRVEPPLVRQPLYAAERRELIARMTAPGARDHHLAQGVHVRSLTVPSSLDGFAIPVLEYSRDDTTATRNDQGGVDHHGDGAVAAPAPSTSTFMSPSPDYVVLYIHGGGLQIGEADSEELDCRRILKEAVLPSPQDGGPDRDRTTASLVVYSVGYRLMPQHPASTCLADCIDVFRECARQATSATKLLLVGSSSGGELAALVAQEVGEAAAARLGGVVLRCPVTSDAFQGIEYVPAALRPLHTTTANLAFQTSILGPMQRAVPRDGLPRMPLEAPPAVLRTQPRHWIQVCTNDMLYADGVCYAKALEMAGVAVRVDVVVGWPHTFWLTAPWMAEALAADRAMLDGLAWVADAP
ncbi:alpha beta hydrolase domain containing protein [Niveomyces insectorum RCEF 264]|uniref:Alpha beta hydrolase domain containing protein n=1 Tax=Niveomyces insectorum RCEF 264 TaxID=1081102 RepID=A0A167UIH6_9HYPO|nr:alpha beta hydrolase domain containing protein [Niveomyces insectorum RCEF 264]